MEEIATLIGDTPMKLRNSLRRLCSVLRAFLSPRVKLGKPFQPLQAFRERLRRFDSFAIGENGERIESHINPDRSASSWNRVGALSLNRQRNKPPGGLSAEGARKDSSCDVRALLRANTADPRKLHATRVDSNASSEPKGVVAPFLFELRKADRSSGLSSFPKAAKAAIQVAKLLLRCAFRQFEHPRGVRAFPCVPCSMIGHSVAESVLPASRFEPIDAPRQGPVPREATRACVLCKKGRLSVVGIELVAVCLFRDQCCAGDCRRGVSTRLLYSSAICSVFFVAPRRRRAPKFRSPSRP